MIQYNKESLMKIFKYTCLIGLLASTPIITYADDNLNSATAIVDDSAISGNVKEKFAHEPALKNINISVTTNQGVVSLSGTLQTEDQLEAAENAAKSITGVKEVDTSNLIEEKSGQPMTDSVITGKVKALFIKEKVFGNDTTAPNMSIAVETKGGVVYLTGTTDKKEQLDKAINLAKSVKNVKDVNSTVVIGSSKK